uniref:Uncharacterized protein n=1 Tax=Entomoneis paludosa TaxID=265537 RepID=A0A7S2V8C0_9STRA|mmetsp:Transcript_11935/g.24578  ORF Transcript_11935/g.24578 Transcript_11935/m.24578 type:complete len:189 (+) Transcript_11935:423-989(+)
MLLKASDTQGPHQRYLQVASDKRQLFWDLFNGIDTCKSQSALWDQAGNRPTLTKTHYIVLPIWWDGEDTSDTMDPSFLQTGLTQIQQYYSEMSFGKHSLTFEIWDQTTLAGVTPTNADFDNSEAAGKALVTNAGKVQFQDYTSILLVYNVAQTGPFSGAGGWAGVNGDFAWTTYFGDSIRSTFEVVRQ